MAKSQIFDDILGNMDWKINLINSNQRYIYIMHFMSAKVAAKMPS